MAHLVASISFAVVTVSSVVGCLLAYSDYDNRFQTQTGEGGTEAFVTDEDAGNISAIAVTSTDLFYATADAIKRLPIDGGAATVWARGTIIDLASNRSDVLAWASNNGVSKAPVADPDAAVIVSTPLGSRGRLASDVAHLAWSSSVPTSSCPCVVGGVEPWMSASPAIALEAGKAPSDIALDSDGVTLFVSSTSGFVRYALDGGVSCSTAAGLLGINTALHAVASGPNGSPFFAIGQGNGSGPLKRYSNACDDAGTLVESSASGVMTDGTNVYWFTNSNQLHAQSIDGGTPVVTLGAVDGVINAMAFGDAYIYVAASTSIYRFAKP